MKKDEDNWTWFDDFTWALSGFVAGIFPWCFLLLFWLLFCTLMGWR